MDAKTTICLALGLGKEDTAKLDEWARTWEHDITPALVEEAAEEADGRLDDIGDWIFYLVVYHATLDVAEELGMDRFDYCRDKRRSDYKDALEINPNGSATTILFDGSFCAGKAELLAAARAWLDARRGA